MEVVFILLPLSLAFVGLAIALFVWAVKRGQFDDLETPAVRMLFDDEPAPAAPPPPPSPPKEPAAPKETGAETVLHEGGNP